MYQNKNYKLKPKCEQFLGAVQKEKKPESNIIINNLNSNFYTYIL